MTHPATISRSNERGSVLFYIFVGIGLFAALSFAVSNMMRGGGTNANREIAQSQATEILQYGRALRTSAQVLQVNGFEETQISFENPIVLLYANGNCPNTGCRLFLPNGGGLSYAKPSSEWLDSGFAASASYGQWFFTGANQVDGVGTTAGTAASGDLIAVLPWLKRSVCTEINRLLGIGTAGANPPQVGADFIYSGTPFTGTFAATQTITGAAEITGQRSACVEGNGNPAAKSFHYYQVLIAR